MKTKAVPEVPKEDKTQIQKELGVTKIIHDALLSVPPDRRGPITQAVCILLKIWIPRE